MIVSDPVISALPGVEYTYDVNAIDPDDDALTYSLTNSPPSMAIDRESGMIEWSVTDDDLGNQPVTVRVDDGRGGFDEQSFTIDVIGNRPPEIVSEPVVNAAPGSQYLYDVNAIDPDEDPLTYMLTESPAEMTINESDGRIVWDVPDQTNLEFAFQAGSDGWDHAEDVTVDNAGNVIITGFFRGTADFDPGPGVFNLTSVADGEPFIAKYSPERALIWAHALNSVEISVGGGGGASVATDHEDNVYITGSFRRTIDFDPSPGEYLLTSSGDLDIYVLKLDSDGGFVWAVTAGDPSPGDSGYALTVDDEGDVYVTGRFYGSIDFDPGPATYALSSVGGADAFVWKLTTDGDFVWARSVGGNHPGSYNFDVGNGIAVDDSHNVYISGQFWNTGDFDPGPDVLMLPHAGPPSEVNSSDAFLVKLDAGGNLAWARGFGGYNGNDMVLDVVVNPVGDVYATGFFSNTVDFDPGPKKFELTSLGKEDIFFLRLDAAGNFVAARAIGGAGSDQARDLAMDCTGSVYLAGWMSESVEFDPVSDSFDLTSVGDRDIFVARLDPYGKTLWARNMGGVAADYGTGVAVDSAGNVYVAGEFRGDADFDPESDGGDLTSVGDLDAFLSKVTQPPPCTPVTVRVEDGRGGFDTQSFVVMDVRGNEPPQIVSAPTANAFLGSTYVHDVDAVDPDYDELTYSLAAAPGGMSIDESNGMITWPAASLWLEQTVAHYRFEEGPHLSPVTTIVDSGPNALHGEVVGNLKYTLNISDYPHSGSYALDATPDLDFGRVLDDPLLHLDGSFRLEALARPKYSGSSDGAAPGIDTIVAKQAYAGGGSFLDAYGIYFSPDTGKFSTAIGFGSGSGISSQATGEKIESENSFSNGQWHHVAASYVLHGSDATLSLYVDGGLEASETFPVQSLFFGNGPLHIGAGNYADDPNGTGLYRRNFRGEIDEIHISTLSTAPGPADVTVRVDDGRGGFDEQSFVIDVLDEEPGRDPRHEVR